MLQSKEDPFVLYWRTKGQLDCASDRGKLWVFKTFEHCCVPSNEDAGMCIAFRFNCCVKSIDLC